MSTQPLVWNDLDAEQRDRVILRQLGAGRSMAALADDLDVSILDLAEHCDTPRFEAVASAAIERQRALAKLSARFLPLSTVTAASAGKGGMASAEDIKALCKLNETLNPTTRERADDAAVATALHVIERESWKLTTYRKV